jgi:hypothetical protein
MVTFAMILYGPDTKMVGIPPSPFMALVASIIQGCGSSFVYLIGF